MQGGGWAAGEGRQDETPTKGGGAPGGASTQRLGITARWHPLTPPPGDILTKNTFHFITKVKTHKNENVG